MKVNSKKFKLTKMDFLQKKEPCVGFFVGSLVGFFVGFFVGSLVGFFVGLVDGNHEGSFVGSGVGKSKKNVKISETFSEIQKRLEFTKIRG